MQVLVPHHRGLLQQRQREPPQLLPLQHRLAAAALLRLEVALLLVAVALLLLLLVVILRYLSVVEAMLSHLSLVVVHLFLAGALPRLLAAAALLLLLFAAILRHLLAAVTQCFRLLLPPHLAVCLRRRHRHHRQRKHLSPFLAVAPVPGVLGFGSSAAVQHALTVFFQCGTYTCCTASASTTSGSCH